MAYMHLLSNVSMCRVLTWVTLSFSPVAVEEEEAVDPTTAEMDGLTFVVEDDEDTGETTAQQQRWQQLRVAGWELRSAAAESLSAPATAFQALPVKHVCSKIQSRLRVADGCMQRAAHAASTCFMVQ
jgi:hypothetical protein